MKMMKLKLINNMIDYMDPHQRDEWEWNKGEYEIYEGLIVSRPIYQVNINLGKKYDIKANYEDNTFYLTYEFNKNFNIAKKQYDLILKDINNYGYHFSNMLGKNKTSYKIYSWSNDNFKKFIVNYKLYNIRFSCEATFNILVTEYPNPLYHLTPSRNFNKIKKIGLVPKSRSKKSYHPERVYLSKTFEDLKPLAHEFYENSKEDFYNHENNEIINKWTVIKINSKNWPTYIKLFKDPNFKERGYYTLNNIPPDVLEFYYKFIF